MRRQTKNEIESKDKMSEYYIDVIYLCAFGFWLCMNDYQKFSFELNKP